MNISEDYVSNNYAAIQIYYRDFTTERAEHLPAYDWNSFLSDCGGQMGLWIGASVFSVAELLSFVVEYILYTIYKENIATKKHVLRIIQSSAPNEEKCKCENAEVWHSKYIDSTRVYVEEQGI